MSVHDLGRSRAPAHLEPRDRIALSGAGGPTRPVTLLDELADAVWGNALPDTRSKQMQIYIAG
jgi:hypothetical protein